MGEGPYMDWDGTLGARGVSREPNRYRRYYPEDVIGGGSWGGRGMNDRSFYDRNPYSVYAQSAWGHPAYAQQSAWGHPAYAQQSAFNQAYNQAWGVGGYGIDRDWRFADRDAYAYGRYTNRDREINEIIARESLFAQNPYASGNAAFTSPLGGFFGRTVPFQRHEGDWSPMIDRLGAFDRFGAFGVSPIAAAQSAWGHPAFATSAFGNTASAATQVLAASQALGVHPTIALSALASNPFLAQSFGIHPATVQQLVVQERLGVSPLSTISTLAATGAHPLAMQQLLATQDRFGTLGLNTLGANTFGVNAFGVNPFVASTIANTLGTNAFGANTFGLNAFGNTLGTSAFGANPFLSNTIGNTLGGSTFGANAFGVNPVATSQILASTLGANAFGVNPLVANQVLANTLGTNAFGANTLGTTAFGANPFLANTLGANAFGVNPFVANQVLTNQVLTNQVLANQVLANQVLANTIGANAFGRSAFGVNPQLAQVLAQNPLLAQSFATNPFAIDTITAATAGLNPFAIQQATFGIHQPFGATAFGVHPFSTHPSAVNANAFGINSPVGMHDRFGMQDRIGFGSHDNVGAAWGIGGDVFGDERGPHFGRGPKGYKRSDDRIREDVCDVIARLGFVDASDVEIVVESGVVRLIGSVAWRRDKRVLEQVIERVHGVEEVRNELRLTRRDNDYASYQSKQAVDRTHVPNNGKNARV
jgi:hypothetical protein